MDAFELISAQLLQEEGFWTIVNYKIDITKEIAKNQLKKPTMPRPEVDILAYKRGTIYLIEVKSYIDSKGVQAKSILTKKNTLLSSIHGRYKLFTWKAYRKILPKLVKNDLRKKGLINNSRVKIKYGLIAGKFSGTSEIILKKYFNSHGWLIWGPVEIKNKVENLITKGYENNVMTILSKILNPVEAKKARQYRRIKRKGARPIPH